MSAVVSAFEEPLNLKLAACSIIQAYFVAKVCYLLGVATLILERTESDLKALPIGKVQIKNTP